jgi:DNA-binding NarL/FixJ family response regulator
MITVLLADDQALVRTGLQMIINAADDLQVIGTAADGVEAVSEAARLYPAIILMDIRMPRLDGIAATAAILQRCPDTRVIMLTTFDRSRLVYDALVAGASGFLLKDVPSDQLLSGIRAVARGEELLAPSITRRLIEEFTRTERLGTHPGIDALTDRELQVLVRIARGRSNAEIAAELFIGLQTVKTHVVRVLAKLGARDRVQAVVIAYESGLVRPGADPDWPE